MFKPLHDRVLIRPEPKKREVAGILLPEDKEKPVIGTVVVGNDLVKEGDRVLFSKFGFDEANIDGDTMYVVSRQLLLGIFE